MQPYDKIRWHLSNVPTAFVWASINWTSWQMCPKYWFDLHCDDFLILVAMAKTPQQQYNVDWKFLRRLWFRFMSMLLAVLVSCGPIRALLPPPCSHCSQETQLKFNSRLPTITEKGVQSSIWIGEVIFDRFCPMSILFHHFLWYNN